MPEPSNTAAPRGASAALIVIAAVAALAALKVGQQIAVPVTLAFVTSVIFGPLSDMATRSGLPRPVAAFVFLLGLLTGAVLLAFAIEPLFWRVVDELPALRWQLRKLFVGLQANLQGLLDVNAQLRTVMGESDVVAGNDTSVADVLPSLADALLFAPQLLSQLLIFSGTLYFLLLCRGRLYDGIAATFDAPVLARRMHEGEQRVAQYFGTVTVINLGLGIAVAIVLTLLNMPFAVAWGIAAGVANYILYLGPALIASGLLLAGFTVFQGALVFAPMAAYLALNLTEAQLVTPTLVGRSVEVNPLLVFLSVVFWLWFWGPAGGVVAIPLLLFVLTLTEAFAPQSPETEAG